MSKQAAGATFTRSRIPTFLGLLVMSPIWVLVAFILWEQEILVVGDSALVSSAIVGGAIAVAVTVLGTLFSGGTATLNTDHLKYRSETVEYDTIALVARKSPSLTERLTGTTTFEVFTPGSDGNMSVSQIHQPDEFERQLSAKVAPPSVQVTEESTTKQGVQGAKEVLGREIIPNRRAFWEYWRAERQLPETAVIDYDTLTSAMDVNNVSVEKLTGVDVSDVQKLSDIDEDDVTSSGGGTLG